MTWYLIFDATTGALREVTESDPATIDLTGAGDPVEVDELPDWTSVRWDPSSRALVADITPQRVALWDQAKTYREQISSAGCDTPSGTVDTDIESRDRINGAFSKALAAKLTGQPFSIDWTMADDSVVTLDADAMIAVGSAVVDFLSQCQAAGTVTRDAINAAANQSALAAINIEAGFPA